MKNLLPNFEYNMYQEVGHFPDNYTETPRLEDPTLPLTPFLNRVDCNSYRYY